MIDGVSFYISLAGDVTLFSLIGLVLYKIFSDKKLLISMLCKRKDNGNGNGDTKGNGNGDISGL